MEKYKLTRQDMTTHVGFKWELGREYVIEKPGTELCSDQVFHYYDSPELAMLLNPIHANYPAPRLFAVECDFVAHDGLKGGAKKMTLTRELPLPEFSVKQRIACALLIALDTYPQWQKHDAGNAWENWARDWLAGDSDAEAAWAAARAARAAWAARTDLSAFNLRLQEIARQVLSLTL